MTSSWFLFISYERQVFSLIEERYNDVTLQNDARQISSIKIGALMNSVHDAIHFTDMTADVAFLSSGFHSLRLRKSAEHLKHYFPNSPTKTDITSRQIG